MTILCGEASFYGDAFLQWRSFLCRSSRSKGGNDFWAGLGAVSETGLVFVGVVAFFDDGGGAQDVEGDGVAAGGLEGDSGGEAVPFCWLADWNEVVRLRPFVDLFLHYGAAGA